MVDAIQLCVDLGIPLKDFTDYYIESSSQIHYAKLVEHGTTLAREKIQTIQERLAMLERIQAEIKHGERIMKSDGMVRCNLPAMYVLVAPYSLNDSATQATALFRSLVRTAEDSGLTINDFVGRPLHCRGARKELFFGIGVDIPLGTRNFPENILHLPAGKYLCCKQTVSAIENAANIFPEQFALDYEKYVVESELPLGDYDCVAPPLELCCLLPGIQPD